MGIPMGFPGQAREVPSSFQLGIPSLRILRFLQAFLVVPSSGAWHAQELNKKLREVMAEGGAGFRTSGRGFGKNGHVPK